MTIKVLSKRGLTRGVFFKRLSRNLLVGLIIIMASLYLGMLGYHHYEKMAWVESFLNAAMILSGMGPVSILVTDGGKVFAGFYAIFSGILFLVVIAVVFAPVIHWFFHRFHLDEKKD